jgi:integrase
MSIEGTKTTSDYIDFDTAIKVGKKLLGNPKSARIGLLILVASNTGLRIGDVLRIQWHHLRNSSFSIDEEKTGKHRIITVNKTISEAVSRFDDLPDTDFVFVSRKAGVYSVQHVNRTLKEAFRRQISDGSNISTHSLRKSFGRRVFNLNDQSEKALIYLSELFNHTSPSITRKYLGIRNEELAKLYLEL